MAKRMVTRTIDVTRVTALCIDLLTTEVYNVDFEITGKVEDPAKLFKAVAKMYDCDEHKVVQIVDSFVESNLYAMPEDAFIANAEIVTK